jgi:hypothetical protein
VPRDLDPRRSSYVCQPILAKRLLKMVGAVSCTRHIDEYWNGYGVYDCNPLPNHLFQEQHRHCDVHWLCWFKYRWHSIYIRRSSTSSTRQFPGYLLSYGRDSAWHHDPSVRCPQTVPWTCLSANENRLLEPTFIIMLAGMFLTFMGLYCGFYFVST